MAAHIRGGHWSREMSPTHFVQRGLRKGSWEDSRWTGRGRAYHRSSGAGLVGVGSHPFILGLTPGWPQTAHIKENLCSEVQLACLFRSASQQKTIHAICFYCPSVFVWYKLCWFFQRFLICYFICPPELRKEHQTSFSFSLPDPGEDEWIWFDDVCALCSLSPFSFSFVPPPSPFLWLPQIYSA